MAPDNPAPLSLTIFKCGNSAALRLPKSLGFKPGERVTASWQGESLVLRHADALGWPLGYFESWEASAIELPGRLPPSDRIQRLFEDEVR